MRGDTRLGFYVFALLGFGWGLVICGLFWLVIDIFILR